MEVGELPQSWKFCNVASTLINRLSLLNLSSVHASITSLDQNESAKGSVGRNVLKR